MTSLSDRAVHPPVANRRARSPRRRTTLLAAGIVATLAATAVARADAQAGDAAAAPSTSTAAASSSTTSPTSSTTTLAPTTTNAAAQKSAAVAVVVVNAATVTKPARRLRQMGSLMFPMQPAPRCDILDNFGDPRSGGRSHEGTDILATSGQEVYAVADGILKRQYVVGGPSSSLSGNAWQLVEPNGTYYFYAHLSAFASGLVVGSTVQRGDLIGYVGDTGDAGPGNNHLHFEVHPGGGAAVNALTLLEIPAGCTIT